MCPQSSHFSINIKILHEIFKFALSGLCARKAVIIPDALNNLSYSHKRLGIIFAILLLSFQLENYRTCISSHTVLKTEMLFKIL